MNTDCSEYRLLLPDLVDGNINALQQQRLDQHLNQCESCTEQLSSLWQMQAAASQWQDERVPNWQRRGAFFNQTPFSQTPFTQKWLPNLHWVSSFASVLVLVLVMTNATIDTTRGLSIEFGQSKAVDEATLTQLLKELEYKQTSRLDETINTLSTQQVATNQLLMRTVMEMSRDERKEELSSLFTVWDYAQDKRSQQTKESISVLLASQLEDKRNIDQINRLLRQASLEGSNL